MGITQPYSTYRDIYGDLGTVVGVPEFKSGEITPEDIQWWILQACEQISDEMDIRDEYNLFLTTDVVNYQFRDRIDAITGIRILGGLVYVTVPLHGRESGEIVRISDVLGIEGINGEWEITVTGENEFTLVDSNLNTDIVDGTYVENSGKIWYQNELPNWIKDVKHGVHDVNGLVRKVDSTNLSELSRLEQEGSLSFFTEAPIKMAIWEKGGTRYLRFFPPPTEDGLITLYCSKQVIAKYYKSDSLDNAIPLSSQFDQIIQLFVRYKIYDRVGQMSESLKFFADFLNAIGRKEAGKSTKVKMEITIR